MTHSTVLSRKLTNDFFGSDVLEYSLVVISSMTK